ncbi:sialidase family protein [Hydrogenovibrio kuenenii]|uniref:sialidase family protein n=1 Tax=Hydrogenovibrio kuenenii TaxID=63658 RepID=UPI000463C7C4|nr:sialidase family protein [Hydrogenovibrio kuenenii]
MSENKRIMHPEIELTFALSPVTNEPVFLHPAIKPLKHEHNGLYVRNQFGQLVWLHDREAYISDDNGQTWKTYSIFHHEGFRVNDCHCLALSHSNTLVVSFIYDNYFNWHRKSNKPTKNTHAHQWVIRSSDGGKTWTDPQLIQKGYAAETMSMVSLPSGRLVFSTQNLDYDAARHYSLSFYSDDDGITWHASNRVDIGGRGHHGGCFEGCLLPLKDGRLWFCIRTNRDWFWNAYSDDDGTSWTQMEKGLPASSSPATIKRLASGRLCMVYNQLYREGENTIERRAGLFSEVAASWQREELSIRFSEDDGVSWGKPTVIASCKGAWLAYPFMFEPVPGKIWITTIQSELRLSLDELDFS